ncbi:Hypothetical protein Ccan_24060 [Capnocytophaga canimorsus Cc5]|uniref:Uncharacterized protein n=1 Tax=Capnocytophaga canimorsus (strain 5) TaxID=860228 RepID=F9YW17_CAPCC|nr:hypothetical protein [Capnocytophaga canimorsus]AEK24520.1 Hypothetical protein Ccan_24060 [Capnocytophaga canimorsus Cc5]
MFSKLKNLASSISENVSESLSKSKENITSVSKSAFETTCQTFKNTKETLASASSSALEGSAEILSKGKNLALTQIADADAEAVADMIDIATSAIPFMRVLDVTDKFGITNKNVLIERGIKGIQEIAKKQLETSKLPNSSQNLLAIGQGQSPPMKLYSQQLEQLIEFALLDNVLTEQERQVLFQKAASEGVDLAEFEMILQAKLLERKQKSE